MRTFLNGETVELNERVPTGETDDYGVLQYRTISRLVGGVAIWPTSSNEVTGGQQDRTNSNYTVALPASVPVSAIDSITWRGLEYEVIGPPEYLRSPMTGNSLQTISISRVEG